jgi:hypothetical protein
MATKTVTAHEYVHQKTIKIKDGEPSPDEVYVRHGAVVRFTNQDPQDYVIRLFAQGREFAPAVDLFLPSFESRTLIAGLDLDANVKRVCAYDVIPTSPGSTEKSKVPDRAVISMKDTKTGGGGTIHVGGN